MFVVAEEEKAVASVVGRDMVTVAGGRNPAVDEASEDRTDKDESDGRIV